MFLFLPLLYFWSRAPMHYPGQIRTLILCLFLVSVVFPVSRQTAPNAFGKDALGDSGGSESNSLDSDEGSLGSPRSRIREGTRISSTMGKFYRNGRRWVFEFTVPIHNQGSDSQASSSRVDEYREVTTRTSDQLTTTTVVSSSSTSTTEASKEETAAPAASVEVIRIRVLENLALQRVVAAIAEDPNDIHWTVTGTITEFGNENWLLLSTVLRSPNTNSE